MTARTTPAPVLGDTDRFMIRLARELGELDSDAIRARAALQGVDGDGYPYVLGEAQPVLTHLADLAERLGGGNA